MTEDELIATIGARVGATDAVVGIGDDAAVLEDGLVVSVDAVIEGTHFKREWLSLAEIGYRGTVTALSDLAAMGANARAVLSSLACPDGREGEAVMEGVAMAASEFGAALVGGNVARSDAIALHTTVIGRTAADPWLRGGARVGDTIYVTGPLGSAALGWRLLERGLAEEPFVSRWRRPRPRFDLLSLLAPSACIDISDGLLSELWHICDASGTGARFELAAVPLDAGFAEAAARIGASADDLVLSGGDDYELLFTARASETGVPIGTIQEGNAVSVVERDGSERVRREGHRHF